MKKSEEKRDKRDPEFEKFVDDLGGFLKSYQRAARLSWEDLAREARLAPTTVRNLANRITKNPMSYTMWRTLQACGRADVINARQLRNLRIIEGRHASEADKHRKRKAS